MLQKASWTSVSDNTNVLWVRIFHLYKGFNRKKSKVGFFLKGSARFVTPPRLEYKGFKFKYYRKGDIVRMLYCRQTYNVLRADGSNLKLFKNNVILIKKKQDTQSKYFHGPIIRELNRKRFLLLFKNVI